MDASEDHGTVMILFYEAGEGCCPPDILGDGRDAHHIGGAEILVDIPAVGV